MDVVETVRDASTKVELSNLAKLVNAENLVKLIEYYVDDFIGLTDTVFPDGMSKKKL